ncbi:Type I restriction-modification system, restriction subunit R [Heyndrickxia coagulans]|nr:Type I restriction-modification system, restriction subunit R [Heyndrickxia coagulans]
MLLVSATGIGKTFIAFQIIWQVWKSRAKKRIEIFWSIKRWLMALSILETK